MNISYMGCAIYFDHDEFQPGRWMAHGWIEDPATGESSPVAVKNPCHSVSDANQEVLRLAIEWIRRGTWRN